MAYTKVKYPVNLQGLDHKKIKFLSVCLELKGLADSGRVPKKLIISNGRFRYYRDKLLSNGIIKPDTKDQSGKFYLVRRYSVIWRLFGISKGTSRDGKHISKVFCKVLDIDLEVEGRKNIQTALFQHVANTLARQIKYECIAGNRQLSRKKNLHIEAPLSSATVAKRFGYKQPCTGNEKRKKYFNLKKEPLQLVMQYIPEINPYRLLPRYKTSTVYV